MLPEFKSLLCVNGNLPEKSWFNMMPDVPLIAADGASNFLIKNGIIPDLIVGDLDSIENQNSTHLCEIIKIPDQSKTDFEKCIIEIEKRNLYPALVLGISGNEIDHNIYNIDCFMRYARKCALIFLNSINKKHYQLGIPIFSKKTFHTTVGQIISLLPYHTACISSMGLKWELNKDNLTTNLHSSIRNEAICNSITVEVHNGQAIMIISYQSNFQIKDAMQYLEHSVSF